MKTIISLTLLLLITIKFSFAQKDESGVYLTIHKIYKINRLYQNSQK
jgi:hypothetical protein